MPFLVHSRRRMNAAGAVVLLSLLVTSGTVLANDKQVAPTTTDARPSAASTGGTIEGTISYSADAKRHWRYDRFYVDKKNGNRLSGCLVCLSGTTLKGAAPRREPATAIVDQKDFCFVPETLAIRAGDSVKFTNSDSSTHNVFTRDDLHPFDITLGGEDEVTETFKRAGGSRRPLILGCKFHGSMRAWIYVFDHPWYQVTGNDGAFSLKGVPAGVYHLEVTHPAGQLRSTKRFEVVAGRPLKFDISLSPDNKFDTKE